MLFAEMQDCFRVNQEVGDSFIYFRLQKSGSQRFMSLRKVLKHWGIKLVEESWQLAYKDE